MQIFLSHVFCVFKTHDVTSFVIGRYSRNNILPQRSRGRRGAISFRSCRSGSRLEYSQTDSIISTDRPRLWKCVRARALTFRHEDEVWMTQMKAFLFQDVTVNTIVVVVDDQPVLT